MANSKKIFEISLSSLSQNGVSCRDIEVIWEKPSCVNVKCEFDGKNTIKVTIPEGCVECIYATVRCKDNTCSDCPDSERIKICPCSTSADCEDCHECVDNLCVSLCEEGQFCDDDRCVDCDPDNPCPQNQVCVAGDCQCPPSKPFKDEKGVCKDCLVDDDCGPCEICTSEGCKPIHCPDGVCDPETGECVGCLNSGDCGENEICVDNDCECLPGFTRDLISGECVPGPECFIDKDCGPCEICLDGDCVPLECPEGYECDSTGTCVPEDPCKDQTCNNGLDCAETCGCLDGECVDCSTLSCDECAETLGCDCTNGLCGPTNDCDDSCETYYDCDEDCTCVTGDCESCSEFPNGECPPGCVDGPDGSCIGDPDRDCNDAFTLEKIDESCDLKATLIKNTPCSCSPITVHLDHNVSGCGVRDVVSTDSAILVVEIPTDNSAVQISNILLKKGRGENIFEVEGLHRLSENQYSDIADNDLPISGTIERVISYYEREELSNGTVVTPEYLVGSDVSTYNLTGSDFSSHPITVYQAGSRIRQSSKVINGVVTDTFIVLVKTVDTYNLVETLSFENNCNYISPQTLFEVVYDDSVDVFGLASQMCSNTGLLREWSRYKTLTSTDERLPLFKWFKSQDSSFSESEIIRKQYIPEINGEYTDTLFGSDNIPTGKYPLVSPEGELWSNRDYQVETDCSCDKFATLPNVVFCNPTELDFSLLECNTKLFINTPFDPCDVNKNLGDNIPDDAIVKYDLYLNGVKVSTFVFDKTIGFMVVEATGQVMFGYRDYTLPSGEEITKVELKINHDTTGECDLSYDIEPFGRVDFRADFYDCFESNFEFTIVSDTTGAVIVDTLYTGTENVIKIGQNRYRADKDVTVGTFEITFSINGNTCTKEVTIPLTSECDCQLSVTTDGVIVEGSDLTINYQSSGASKPFNYTIKDSSDVTIDEGVLTTNSGTVLLTKPISGTYDMTIVDQFGCEATTTFTLGVLSTPNVEVDGTFVACQGDTAFIEVNGGNQLANGSVQYTIDGGSTQTLILNNSGQATISNINGSFTYNFLTATDSLSNVYTVGKIVQTEIITTPTVSLVTSSETICENDSVDLQFSGTPGATVITTAGTVILDNNGDGTITITPVSTTTYTITSVTLGDCLGNIGSNTAQVIVVPSDSLLVTNEGCVTNSPLSDYQITYNFNLTGARDQLNNDILSLVTGNVINVPANSGITLVIAEYDNGACVANNTASVQTCSCPAVVGTVSEVDGCVGGQTASVELTQVTVDGNIVTNYGVEWYDGNNVLVGTSDLYNVPSGTNQGFHSYTYIVTINSGTYQGCSTTGISNVFIGQVAQVEITNGGGQITDDPYQMQVNVLHTFSTNNSYSNYSWSVTDGSSQNGPTQQFSWTPASVGSYVITATVTDQNGCESTDTLNVFVSLNCDDFSFSLDENSVEVTVVDESCGSLADGSISIVLNSGTAPYTVTGDLGALITNNLGEGTYSGNIIDSNGCQASYTIEVGIGASSPIVIKPVATSNNAWSSSGTYFYDGDYTANGVDVNEVGSTVNFTQIVGGATATFVTEGSIYWRERMRLKGVRTINSPTPPFNEGNLTAEINIPTTGVYTLGFGVDNIGYIRIDGDTKIITHDDDFVLGPNVSFKRWHVVELTLTSGTHCIEIGGNGQTTNATDPFGFAYEIYNSDITGLLALSDRQSINDVVIVDSRTQVGGEYILSDYSCSDGGNLTIVGCEPICDC